MQEKAPLTEGAPHLALLRVGEQCCCDNEWSKTVMPWSKLIFWSFLIGVEEQGGFCGWERACTPRTQDQEAVSTEPRYKDAPRSHTLYFQRLAFHMSFVACVVIIILVSH